MDRDLIMLYKFWIQTLDQTRAGPCRRLPNETPSTEVPKPPGPEVVNETPFFDEKLALRRRLFRYSTGKHMNRSKTTNTANTARATRKLVKDETSWLLDLHSGSPHAW
eukprot:6183411-Pleurochrysis_carterae.AAC.2